VVADDTDQRRLTDTREICLFRACFVSFVSFVVAFVLASEASVTPISEGCVTPKRCVSCVLRVLRALRGCIRSRQRSQRDTDQNPIV
jgi:hypothetical protein